ncbi:MAG: CoA transferase [Gammaproteobacteria bacterium]|jgi:itaconate CoA-transferase|nr:CoA transferase [Gammaproteobacteria bacterium]MBT3859185.1 CoA transferase [Gammaproteobacteria bacterium]MBT3985911.1 CoA transferase [Gammaproteobacteria bacterium]MBT4583114.1 CoA transferase [Gammaproteobacteria bacterium]MBT4658485.1 CoA transferase [Gammaproteobacteria bacterium]
MSAAPLTGLTVVSLEHAIAAPLCTRQLAELGARVIKIERREKGDFARYYDQRVKGQSSHFIWTNRSKESLTLDLKHPEANVILDKLLAETDILVQNLAPGAVEKMGLSFEHLQEKYPKLIACNISGYGKGGPYQSKKAYDLLVQAEAGFLSITGNSEEGVKSGISIADIAAGMQAQSAILAAIILRSRTGKGSEINISMLEAMVEWMGFPLYYAYEGANPPARTGSDHASIYPYGAFATGDDKVLMLGLQNEREWEVFCRVVLEQEQLLKDPRFENNPSRSSNREELKNIIETMFSSLTADQVSAKLDEAQIAFSNVNDMAAVWDHPQLRALERIVKTETAEGVVDSFLPPGNNSEYEATLGPVPSLGQHSKAILEELGFSKGQIDGFYQRNLV